jgi:hypothetical protein
MSTTSSALQTERGASGSLLRRGAFAAIGAAVANLIVYFVGTILVSDLSSFPVLNVVSVMASSVVGAVAGTGVFALLARFSQRPVTIFRIVAVVVALLSLGGPINAGQGMAAPPLPGVEPGAILVASPGTVVLMIVMHIVAAAVITWVLTKQGREG